MLEKLHVEGYALIDSVEINLSRGLNVLSGETGAGKSILVDALSLLLGEKGDAGSVREPGGESIVAGVFRVDGNDGALSWLAERGIDPEDGEVILRRTLKENGPYCFSLRSSSLKIFQRAVITLIWRLLSNEPVMTLSPYARIRSTRNGK